MGLSPHNLYTPPLILSWGPEISLYSALLFPVRGHWVRSREDILKARERNMVTRPSGYHYWLYCRSSYLLPQQLLTAAAATYFATKIRRLTLPIFLSFLGIPIDGRVLARARFSDRAPYLWFNSESMFCDTRRLVQWLLVNLLSIGWSPNQYNLVKKC